MYIKAKLLNHLLILFPGAFSCVKSGPNISTSLQNCQEEIRLGIADSCLVCFINIAFKFVHVLFCLVSLILFCLIYIYI